ncbi:alpha-1,4-glucan--maltose-1-phosphate maltosyltransferase [Saprospiraceae bacterium]|jgi:starch synthase (maltosyl-transferring)|nr:alpha-1,4-glucan--maltose-1-phosphate maltosyltransferase [Bacteroidota bacterium]MDB4727395.1 alpha-1,4-glucan--maltose-1-phosphate maltosyltransferase [Saprospiraceae bacterium]MDF1867967.1 alpha-1,4-glucan--maltose-1-phosphate maltosyltransferase [Saprospiraceae bacterium]
MRNAQSRVIIEAVHPELDNGKHYIKRTVGESVNVEADIFGDGHDIVAATLLYRHEGSRKWSEVRLSESMNDRWSASFKVDKQGHYHYKIEAWIDYALNWQHNIARKAEDNQYVNVELLDGIQYLEYVKSKMPKNAGNQLDEWIALFRDENQYESALRVALSSELHELFVQHPSKKFSFTYDNNLRVYVDREKARFSTWYEFFPRSASSEKGKHGTFKDCERLIPRVAEMGFDTLYFPPIHPIGEVNRKGKNNATVAESGDVGSPWGIGSRLGGHKDIHPELGSLEDFKSLVQTAKNHGVEIALDFALQCAPDHPYVKSNPQWFKWRPDGSVQYAENPPKKYQDILPIYFETEDWKNLWDELVSIAIYWVDLGIEVFRVDNPHTKPYRFWEHLIATVKKHNPNVLFLAEAFTRPRVMHELAKVGFTQSYTYFTWRNFKHELVEYMNELSKGPGKEYFRPNFWPNTPDINPYPLQGGNETIHMIRFFLAATLSSNYGMYGPVYEYMVHAAMPGKEEYLDSEKYEFKHWDWEVKNKMTYLITNINRIRRENPAFQFTDNIHICNVENDKLLVFYKETEDKSNQILCAVNLDPYSRQSGWVKTPLDLIGVREGQPMVMQDLLTGNSYTWAQEWNFVELDPGFPFHLFKITK